MGPSLEEDKSAHGLSTSVFKIYFNSVLPVMPRPPQKVQVFLN